jgi:hypothetical protein
MATGDADEGIWSAGQFRLDGDVIPTCAELVGRIMRDAEAIIQSRLGNAMCPAAAVRPRNKPFRAPATKERSQKPMFTAPTAPPSLRCRQARAERHQVLVRVHACGLNRADLGMTKGHVHGRRRRHRARDGMGR